MKRVGFTYWQDGADWIGHLDDFPDYQTQGSSLEDLKAHLLDLHRDLSSTAIPAISEGVRRMEDIIKGHTTGLSEDEFYRALR